MRSLLILGSFATLLGFAYAQTSVQPITPPSGGNVNVYGGGGWGGGYHSSTAAEGSMRGMGSLVRSQGQANLDNSAAAINYSVARSQELDNHKQYTDTYFQMRQMNREAREAERGPRPSMEDLVRYAQIGKPQPLSPSQFDTVSGQISWPAVLQAEQFADGRQALEAAFNRQSASGVMAFQDTMTVRQTTDAMLAQLKESVRELPPDEYLASRKFLESLAYTAGRPTG